jgi:hypothetical protein
MGLSAIIESLRRDLAAVDQAQPADIALPSTFLARRRTYERAKIEAALAAVTMTTREIDELERQEAARMDGDPAPILVALQMERQRRACLAPKQRLAEDAERGALRRSAA